MHVIKLVLKTIRRGVKYIRRYYFPTPKERVLKRFDDDNGKKRIVEYSELDESSLIIDVGGYIGDFTAEISARYGCLIYVFEPVPAFARELRARFEKNKKINIQEIGLGSQTVKESIICDGDASSLYKGKETKSESGIDVSIIDVVEWFDINQIENVSLMAINAEGEEYPLLDRLIESGYISKIENLLVQFHDIYQKDAEERMNRIQRELLKTHQPVFQYKFVWERWKRK